MLVSELVRGVRLDTVKYRPATTPCHNENASQNFLFVLPLLHGQLKLERDNKTLHDGPVQPGMVRVIRPGERSSLTPQAEFVSAMLTVPRVSLESVAQARGINLGTGDEALLPPVLSARYDVQRLTPLLRTATELPERQRSLLVTGLAVALLALILNSERTSIGHRGPGFDQSEFDRILAFATSRLAERLDLTEWADMVGLSANEFARRFQQHTGVAPYTWFMDRRIDEAKRLMTQSDASLVEVALDAGFCSQSHFTEAFRRRVGKSPGRWRSAQFDPTI